MRLVEVLQNDSYVHVDHNHVVDDDETGEVQDRQQWISAVPVRLVPVVGITLGRLHHQRFQDVVPAGGSDQPKEEMHRAAEGLEVDHVVQSALQPDVAEQEHADDGVDEGDEG